MHDFVPEDLFNFLIEADKSVYWYETISHTTPTLIKGAYYVHGGGGDSPIPLRALII